MDLVGRNALRIGPRKVLERYTEKARGVIFFARYEGELARRIADGNVPHSLTEKAILAIDLPPLRALEKGRFMARETGSCPWRCGKRRPDLLCEPEA